MILNNNLNYIGISHCVLMSAAIASSCAHAYPDKPVRVIVPQAAGSSFDSVLRLLSQRLTERWKQQVVVDNRPGANSIILRSGYSLVRICAALITFAHFT